MKRIIKIVKGEDCYFLNVDHVTKILIVGKDVRFSLDNQSVVAVEVKDAASARERVEALLKWFERKETEGSFNPVFSFAP